MARFSESDKTLIWDRRGEGVGMRTVARESGRAHASALIIEDKLSRWWSPQQVSGWLKEAYPDSPETWVSHETIYLTLFVQGRGALKDELTQCLRTHRAIRRPAKKRAPTGKGQIRNPVMISERPTEAEDRAVRNEFAHPGGLSSGIRTSSAEESAIGHLRFTAHSMRLLLCGDG